jgi:hypothetical protein
MNPPMDAFRDSHQRALACRALLATGGLERFWTERGPTQEGRALAGAEGATLAPGGRALLLAAWAFWSGERSPLRFDELVGLPEAEPIAKLAVATIHGPQAVDAWLTRSDEIEGFVGDEEALHAGAARLFDEAARVFAEKGEEPMNFRSTPDACALGALRMADYVLLVGVKAVDDEEARLATATRLTGHVLALSAAMESERAEGGDAEEGDDEDLDDDAEEGPGTDRRPC